MAKKIYEDDDGRTIADMSGVERQPLILPRIGKKKKTQAPPDPDTGEALPEWKNEDELSPEERRAMFLSALGSAVLIALIFIGLGAVVVWLLTRVW